MDAHGEVCLLARLCAGACEITSDGVACADSNTGCGLMNGAQHTDACEDVYYYNGEIKSGCESISEVDRAHKICPTKGAIDSQTKTFDPAKHAYGHCSCGLDRRTRAAHPIFELIEKKFPYQYRKVEAGETWKSIAAKAGVALSQIVRYNGFQDENVGLDCTGADCSKPVPGTFVVTSRPEAILPECQCQTDGYFTHAHIATTLTHMISR